MSDPGRVHCVECEHTALMVPRRIPEFQLCSGVPNDVVEMLIVTRDLARVTHLTCIFDFRLHMFLLPLGMVLRTMPVAKCCQDVRLSEFWSVLSS